MHDDCYADLFSAGSIHDVRELWGGIQGHRARDVGL